MLAAMERRIFLGASIAGAAGLALPAVSRAQRRAQSAGRVTRPSWSESGPPDGREPRDPTAPDADERLHAPVVRMPARVEPGRAFDLAVQIGLAMHPMTGDHRIGWIDCFVGEERVWVVDLSAHVPYPVARIPLRLAERAPITVRAWCTQHGVWRTRVTL
jgi:desulfoferrodoxin (superoxide reductase-like protein)